MRDPSTYRFWRRNLARAKLNDADVMSFRERFQMLSSVGAVSRLRGRDLQRHNDRVRKANALQATG